MYITYTIKVFSNERGAGLRLNAFFRQIAYPCRGYGGRLVGRVGSRIRWAPCAGGDILLSLEWVQANGSGVSRARFMARSR